MAIAESNVIDAVSGAMFCRFHEVDEVFEAGVAGKPVGQVLPLNFSNGRDFDMTFFEPVAATDFDMRSFPDAYTGGDFAAFDTCAEFFGKKHVRASDSWSVDC